MIYVKDSSIHGLGAFTDEPIDIGAEVGRMHGALITREDYEASNDKHLIAYISPNVFIDFSNCCSSLMKINCSRQPNTKILLNVEGWAAIVALVDIQKDAELTANYPLRSGEVYIEPASTLE